MAQQKDNKMNSEFSTFGRFDAGDTPIVLDDVAGIAKNAGDVIMEIYNGTSEEDWKKIADFKSDGSPLTMADKKANDVICAALTKAYPKIPIISEENKLEAYAKRKEWKYFWCVDPLDGTKEFIKRNGQFTVNIGLCCDGKPIAGVVFVPASDPPVMYKGALGLGPPVKEEVLPPGLDMGYDSFVSLACKAFKETDSGLTIVASASHNTPETDAFIAKYDEPKKKSLGSSLKLLMVAEGAAHIYPRLAPTCEWDTCAAHAIVVCAGGEVLQAEGGAPCTPGAPVVYNKENALNPFFIVYGKRVAPAPKKGAKAAGGGGPPMMMILAILVALIACGAVFLLK